MKRRWQRWQWYVVALFAIGLAVETLIYAQPAPNNCGLNMLCRVKTLIVTGSTSFLGGVTTSSPVSAAEFDGGTFRGTTMDLSGALGVGGDITSGGTISGNLDAGAAYIGALNIGDDGAVVSGTYIGSSDVRTEANFLTDRQLRLFPNTGGAFLNGYSSIEMAQNGSGTAVVVPWGVLSFTTGTEDAGSFSFAGGPVGINGTTIHGGEVWTPAVDAGAVAAADVYAATSLTTGGTATAGNFDSTAPFGGEAYNIPAGAYFYGGAYPLWDWNQDGGHIDILQPTHFNGSATFGYLVAAPTIDAGSVMASSMQITEQNGTIACGASNVMQEVVRTTDGGTFKFLCDGDGFWNFVSKGLDSNVMGSARSGPSIARGYVMGGFRPYLPGYSLHLERHVLASGTGAGFANWTVQKRRSDAGVANICNAYTSCTAANSEWPDITPCAGAYNNWEEDVLAVTIGYDGGCTQVPDTRIILTAKRGVSTLPAGDTIDAGI